MMDEIMDTQLTQIEQMSAGKTYKDQYPFGGGAGC